MTVDLDPSLYNCVRIPFPCLRTFGGRVTLLLLRKGPSKNEGCFGMSFVCLVHFDTELL